MQKFKVWDAPTRLFHWALPLMLAALWWSAQSGQLLLHTRLGVALLVLLLFRLLWGVFGSQSARFASFVRGPAAIRRYLRGDWDERAQPGHNPLGALMVLALLAALLLQAGLGLFAADTDGYTYDGPLARLIGGELAETVSGWHAANFNLLLGLVALHLAAIVAYRLMRRVDLVRPMLSGCKQLDGATPLAFASPWRALLLLALAAGLVYGALALL